MASIFKITQSGKVGKKINITYYQYGNTVRFFLDNTPTSQIQILFIATNGSGISDIISLDSDNVLYTLKSSAMRYDSQLTGVDTINSVNIGRKCQLYLTIRNWQYYTVGMHMEFKSYYPYLNGQTSNCNGVGSSVLQEIQSHQSVTYYGEFLLSEKPSIRLWADNNIDDIRQLFPSSTSPTIPGLKFPSSLWYNEDIPFSATINFPDENNNFMNPLEYDYKL